MSSYPCPSHALQVWLAGDKIAIGIPGSEPGRGHTLFVDPNEIGMRQLYKVLSEKAVVGAARPKIGFQGAPTQYDLELIARAVAKAKPKPKPQPKDYISLEELGL